MSFFDPGLNLKQKLLCNTPLVHLRLWFLATAAMTRTATPAFGDCSNNSINSINASVGNNDNTNPVKTEAFINTARGGSRASLGARFAGCVEALLLGNTSEGQRRICAW